MVGSVCIFCYDITTAAVVVQYILNWNRHQQMDPNLRNLKDFLTLYNKVTEICFHRCIDNFNERDLADHETTCVNRCVNKFAQFNQKMMKVYVEIQTNINAKRVEELEALQKEQQQSGSSTTTASSTFLSSSSTSNLAA